jgi:hypothetical protein
MPPAAGCRLTSLAPLLQSQAAIRGSTSAAAAASRVRGAPDHVDVRPCAACQGSGSQVELYEFRRLEVRQLDVRGSALPSARCGGRYPRPLARALSRLQSWERRSSAAGRGLPGGGGGRGGCNYRAVDAAPSALPLQHTCKRCGGRGVLTLRDGVPTEGGGGGGGGCDVGAAHGVGDGAEAGAAGCRKARDRSMM